jgi:type II secretory pathway component GspD/PulD (secretin)
VKKACGVKKAQRAVQVRAIKGLAENQKSECAGGNSGRWYVLMDVKVVVAILLIAAVPLCALAQKPSAVTRADAQRVLKTISGDKAKTRTYCDIAKLVNKITEGDEEQTDGLYEKIDELGKKLGPEYAALMDRLQNIDPDSEIVQEIDSMFAALDKLCAKSGR